MRFSILFAAAVVTMLSARPASADYMVDFIRISCVPEAGFFEIEHRSVHNNPAKAASTDAWARQGFHSPSGLVYECDLRGTKYKVMAEQEGWRERGMCAAAPEVFVSVLRNEVKILDKVVLGFSCFGSPTITRMSRTEKKQGYFGAEAQVCFLENGQDDTKPTCEWFFEGLNGLDAAFPLRQESLRDQFKKWRPK